MGYIIRMPKLGLEMEQGTLLEWKVGLDEEVAEGEVIAEIESEKTTAEIEAREDGVLRRTFIEEGDTVEPSTAIGILAGPDEDISDLEAEVDEGDLLDEAEADTGSEAATPEAGTSPSTGAPAGGGGGADVKASPRAEQRAEELGVDLGAVEGSGPGGAITEGDVEAAAEGSADAHAPAVSEERRLDGMRRTIADRLGQSYREAVHVTVRRSVDAEALLDAADAAEDALDADVSINDLLLAALSRTFEDHPEFNATYEDEVHRLHDDHNICVAVDVEAGLVAPVVREVDSKTLAELAEERKRVVERTLAGEYTMDDLAGGTFTVSNLGVLGVESFDPIINPPQIAILGVNGIEQRPVPGDDGEVAFRRFLPLDLSFDHRIVDGADAARFLETLAEHLEEPTPLLPDEVSA